MSGNPINGHGHDHHHDHDFAQPTVVRPAQYDHADFLTRLIDRILRIVSKAYVHIRYSPTGNWAAMLFNEQWEFASTAFNNIYHGNYRGIFNDTLVINTNDGSAVIDGEYYPPRRARSSPGVNSPVGYTFSWLEWILLTFIALAEIGAKLSLNLVGFALYLVWRLVRWIFRPLFVCGSLVFGARLCMTVFQDEPPVWTFPACAVFALWAVFIAVSYVDYPERWNVSSWPKWPRAIARASRSWYRSPVFWNIVGAYIIIWAQNRGITEPLFEEPLIDESFVELFNRWYPDYKINV